MNDAAEIKLRAERRAGELLAVAQKHPGSRNTAPGGPTLPPPKLSEIGITKNQSQRWQKDAAVPAPAFESFALTEPSRGVRNRVNTNGR